MVAKRDVWIVVLLFVISVLVTYYFSPLDKRVIPVKFEFGENPGFDLTKSELTFGKITSKGGASRKVMVENTYNQDVVVRVKASGEASRHLIVSENNFILVRGESKEIDFTVLVDELTEIREYVGEVRIIIYRK